MVKVNLYATTTATSKDIAMWERPFTLARTAPTHRPPLPYGSSGPRVHLLPLLEGLL